jgi:hypothetical protein
MRATLTRSLACCSTHSAGLRMAEWTMIRRHVRSPVRSAILIVLARQLVDEAGCIRRVRNEEGVAL